LKNKQTDISKFTLSPQAKAGMIIKNLAADRHAAEHDHSKPHRDDHYQLLFAYGGSLVINIDFKEFQLAAPTLLLIFPGQIHHTVSVSHLQGWAISIDPSLIDMEFQLVFDQRCQQPLPLKKESAFVGHARVLLAQMEKIQGGLAQAFQLRVQHSMLDALLGLLAGEATPVDNPGLPKADRGSIILRSFTQLLKAHYQEWKQPARYAAELNISVAHLYDIIKGSTGESVSTFIQQYCMLEAKRMLCFSKFTVKEIAYQLGYEEPVYFGKLFKKTTGITPLQFRRQYHD
jgi:AraC family transcriptional activator of pobA